MKTAPAAVANFVAANNVGWRADLYTLTLLNGTVYRWTNSDVSITLGGFTYLAQGAVLGRGNLRVTSQLEVDQLEVLLAGAFVLPTGLTIALSSLQGALDYARLRVDHLVGAFPGDTSLGAVGAFYEGKVAGLDPTPDQVRVVVVSDLEQLMQQVLPRFLYGPVCGNAVYDPVCTLVRSSFTLAGTVSNSPAPTDTAIATATPALTAKAAGYFNLGVLAFTSGALAGSRRAVESWNGTTFTLARPFKQAPGVGDAFTVYPGCHLDTADCDTKFANLVNFRGFPHVPVNEGGI